jgi:pimeloyl-ACP methyl ester carboxylesterase
MSGQTSEPSSRPSLWDRLIPFPVRLCTNLAVDVGLATALTAGDAVLRLAPGGTHARQAEDVPTAPQWKPPRSPRGRRRTVTTDDGVDLHVEVSGSPRSDVTVVLCHGYGLNLESWGFQREALRAKARVVTWDQRGHGRSGHGSPEQCRIERLGEDLLAVLQAAVPAGPIVLVGHSMGGMSIFALAARRPDLFRERVVGVGLLATAAGPVHAHLGLPRQVANVVHRAIPSVLGALRAGRPLSSWAARDLALLLTRRFGFASEVPTDLVTFLADMIQQTSIDTLANFFPEFRCQDNTAALPVLRDIRTLVMVGDGDLLTPVEDSQVIVDALPDAEFVVAAGAGHAVLLEREVLVTAYLLGLLDQVREDRRASPSRRTARPSTSVGLIASNQG